MNETAISQKKFTFGAGELNILDWERTTVSEVIALELSSCNNLDILVGYFYFDGLEEIRQALEANKSRLHIRILVGMEAGVDARRIVEYAQRREYCSGIDPREDYLQSLKDVVEALGPTNDNPNSHKIAALYAELIDAGRLEIRQTLDQNHSKLYIFGHQAPSADCYVVGSSNFSCPGISTRNELNVHIQRAGMERMKELFKNLWETAQPLTRYKEGQEDKVAETIRKDTKFAVVAPYDAYLMVMQRYLRMYEGKEDAERIRLIIQSAKGDYVPYQYQVDAVSRALTILRRTNGVLVADVVGLGKSVVAATIARACNGAGVILCPPHLIADWDGAFDEKGVRIPGYFEQFRLDAAGWRVFSMYQLDKVRESIKQTDMIIIDEAHRFRNPTLDWYSELFALCAGRKVVLLTATPFNNRPRDIHALLGLFMDPNAVCANGRTFQDAMEVLDKQYMDALTHQRDGASAKAEAMASLSKISGQMFQIMQEVTIRRNRLDLKNNPIYCAEVAQNLSEQSPPLSRSYKLAGETGRFFDRVLAEHFGGVTRFKGAIYRPTRYLKENTQLGVTQQEDQSQENYYGMLCRFLVNRFESSFAAFRESIQSVRDYTQTAFRYLERDHVLVLSREFFRRIEDQDDAKLDFQRELNSYREGARKNAASNKKGKLKTVAEYPQADLDIERFRRDVKTDITLLDEILAEIDRLKLLEKGHDPKLEALIEEIRSVFGGRHREIPAEPGKPVRKVVVFSSFADTVSYIGMRIAREFPGQVLVVVGNQTSENSEVRNLDENVRETIEVNFDAKKGRLDSPLMVLVATDTISEGKNLNQAGLVINYDIPWNPTRVIQRIGRINRISKKVFDNIYVMNLFPSDEGEKVIGKVVRVKSKLQMIHEIVREDAQILDTDETPSAAELEAKIGSAVEATERAGRNEETRVRERMEKCEKAFVSAHGKVAWNAKLETISSLPSALKVVARNGGSDGLAVFKDNGLMLSALWVENVRAKEPIATPMPFPDALDKVACDESTNSAEFGPDQWNAYNEALGYRPLLETKPAHNLWKKASNMLRTEALYTHLNPTQNELRLRMLDVCESSKLSTADLRCLRDVKTHKDLLRVIQQWANTKDRSGSEAVGPYEGSIAQTQAVLAFGTVRQAGKLLK